VIAARTTFRLDEAGARIAALDANGGAYMQ
jgi:hypothetical protein